MTKTPPVAPDRAHAPPLHSGTPPHSSRADADSFSHSNPSPDHQEPSIMNHDTKMTDPLSEPNMPPATSMILAPPSPNSAASEDDAEDYDDDDTVLSDPVVSLKEYSIQSTFRLSKQNASNHMQLFKDLAIEMMNHDSSFKINAYERDDASELWPLASADDFPTNDEIAQRYFVNIQLNQQRNTASVTFRVISQHSHVKWRKILSTYLSSNRISLKQHKLEALDTTCIGFLARKHPNYTHLHYFEEYLRATLPDTTPQFYLRHLKPHIPAGFAEAVQTEVIGIQTSKEHAPRLVDIFTNSFPLNTEDREFFISFRSGLENDKLRSLYRMQNKWLAQVKIIRLGSARNIDIKVDVGLPYPVSLREFIRDKPKEPPHVNLAMDVENGGRDRQPVIIVLPKYMSAAEAIYEDFRQSAKQPLSTSSTNPASHDSISSPHSSRDPAYDAKLAEFLAITYLSDSDSNDSVPTSNEPVTQQYLTAPNPTHGANRSTKRSTGRRRSGRSYAAVATRPHPGPLLPALSSQPNTPTPPPTRPRVSTPTQPPPNVQADPASSVSTLTNAQQSDILIEVHSMLKEQRQEIKKLKKRHELSKRTTINLQHRIDSICNSLDELSRRTMDSDLSSADISSALSMVSSQCRSDNSSDSLDSKYGRDDNAHLPSRSSPLFFTKAQSCTFGVDDPPVEIQARRLNNDNTSSAHLTSDSDTPSTPRPSAGWLSPKKKKSHKSSLKLATITQRPLVTNNPFSPLAEDSPTTASSTNTLSSLGRTRSPSKTPAPKKLRSSLLSPSDQPDPPYDVVMQAPNSPPQQSSHSHPPDHDMTWEYDTASSTPVTDVLNLNESVDESL